MGNYWVHEYLELESKPKEELFLEIVKEALLTQIKYYKSVHQPKKDDFK